MEGGKITDQSANTIELQVLPHCYLAWLSKEEKNAYPGSMTTNIPVYFNLGRESLLCQFTLPQIGDPNSKIISGAAIFLQGSE